MYIPKIITILLFSLLPLWAGMLQSVRAEYDISYAIFGTIGHSFANLDIDDDQYRIHIEAKASGIAKLMSQERVEVYESRGIVKEGRLVPLHFAVKTQKGLHYVEKHVYRFDHAKKSIVHHSQILDHARKEQKDKLLSYYAKDDILTLFFNLPYYLSQQNCTKKPCDFVAVGANEKDGRVDIQKSGENFKVRLNRRIFASKKGDMLVHLNKNGLCDTSILKDVVFFGDVKAKATKIIYQK